MAEEKGPKKKTEDWRYQQSRKQDNDKNNDNDKTMTKKKTEEWRYRQSRRQDLVHIFIFLLLLVVFHILLVQLTSKELTVNQQIVVRRDIRPVMQRRALSPIKHSDDGEGGDGLETNEKKRPVKSETRYGEKNDWAKDAPLSRFYQLTRYKPLTSWPAGMTEEERMAYFLTDCADRVNKSRQEASTCTPDTACNGLAEVGKEIEGCALDTEMQRRRNIVATTCKSLRPKEVNAEKLFVLKQRRLVWCPVYKAASTNWMKNLPRLSGLSPNKVQKLARTHRQVNSLARAVVPHVNFSNLALFMESQPKPVSFLIVRHPFDRLLSAYRDKLERYNGYYYKKYGKAIVRSWRHQGLIRFGPLYSGSQGRQGRQARMPSWWEFVMAVLNDQLLDDHWRPMLDLCSVCGIEYDFLIKFEHLSREEEYLRERLRLKDVIGPRWENKNRKGRATTKELRDSYFGQLSEDEVFRLYQLYESDFQAFEYELPPKYLIRVYNETASPK